ncbi:hypothetical protein BC835DRAFT_1512788 [Cytidiella melzeri]|nr:hypothetical protein BC835DRAFT_1512788 [Cytidiella melzeri]
MYTIVVWDWAIALPRKYRFIWKTHWTPVKVAYLLCRYWVIAAVPYFLWAFCTNHTVEECEKIYRIPVALAMWNQVTSEVILVIRTYAFFNRNNYILTLLVVALAGVVAYQLYVDTSEMLLLPFLQETGPCLPMSKPHLAQLLGFFVSAVLLETGRHSYDWWPCSPPHFLLLSLHVSALATFSISSQPGHCYSLYLFCYDDYFFHHARAVLLIS